MAADGIAERCGFGGEGRCECEQPGLRLMDREQAHDRFRVRERTGGRGLGMAAIGAQAVQSPDLPPALAVT